MENTTNTERENLIRKIVMRHRKCLEEVDGTSLPATQEDIEEEIFSGHVANHNDFDESAQDWGFVSQLVRI